MPHGHDGGNGGAAACGVPGGWIDLSTGINRRPWPVDDLPPEVDPDLPIQAAEGRLIQVAANWFGCPPSQVLPLAGTASAIQRIARLLPVGQAAVIAPADNDHAADLRAAGWPVALAETLDAMAGTDLAVVCNPNDPDGREWSPAALAGLADRVGHLVIDESLADARPDLSLIPTLPPNTLILRSLGPFWGLAGLRLGFVVARPVLLDRLSCAADPWTAVDAAALRIGALAMADRIWADDTLVHHAEAALRLDRIAMVAGWRPAGGTHFFRLYETADAAAAQDRLTQARIGSRRFCWSRTWLRLGIPACPAEWDRLASALRKF